MSLGFNLDDLFYYVDWGDESNTGWIGPVNSGQTITRSHTWFSEGYYVIKAKAKDIYDEEGPEGTLIVTMPRNRVISNIFLLWLLEQFQFLEKLFNLL